MIDVDGRRENLMIGTYTDLRRVQESCGSLEDPAQIRKRVNEMKVFLASSVTETLAVKFDNSNDEPTKPMHALSSDVPSSSPGGLLNLETITGVLVATVVQPERADDASYLKNELLSLLDCDAKIIVLDLGRVINLSPGSFKVLTLVRDKFRESGVSFALCNLTRAMMQNLRSMNAHDILRVFENQALALSEMKP